MNYPGAAWKLTDFIKWALFALLRSLRSSYASYYLSLIWNFFCLWSTQCLITFDLYNLFNKNIKTPAWPTVNLVIAPHSSVSNNYKSVSGCCMLFYICPFIKIGFKFYYLDFWILKLKYSYHVFHLNIHLYKNLLKEYGEIMFRS